MAKKKVPTSVGGDNIQITIGSGAKDIAAGKNVRQSTHETTFQGPVHGPVHTGSGDIQAGRPLNGASDRGLAQLQTSLSADLGAARYRLVTAVIDRLQEERLREVQALATALKQGRWTEPEMHQLLIVLRPELDEAEVKAALPLQADSLTATEIVDAPGLDVAHKLGLILPLISFLLDDEGKMSMGSRMNLGMTWQWLKSRLE